MGRDGDLVEQRLARGCRCFIVTLDEQLAGYGWLSTGPEWIGELQLEIRPGDLEGYIWNCVTLEPVRRRGVFKSLLDGIAAHARAGGVGRLWIGSVAIPAEKALPPAGFRPALRFASASLGPFNWMRVSLVDEHDLAMAAMKALRIRPGSRLRRSRRRRH